MNISESDPFTCLSVCLSKALINHRMITGLERMSRAIQQKWFFSYKFTLLKVRKGCINRDMIVVLWHHVMRFYSSVFIARRYVLIWQGFFLLKLKLIQCQCFHFKLFLYLYLFVKRFRLKKYYTSLLGSSIFCHRFHCLCVFNAAPWLSVF